MRDISIAESNISACNLGNMSKSLGCIITFEFPPPWTPTTFPASYMDSIGTWNYGLVDLGAISDTLETREITRSLINVNIRIWKSQVRRNSVVSVISHHSKYCF